MVSQEGLCSMGLNILPHIPEDLSSHKYFYENLASRKYDAAVVWFYSVTRYSFFITRVPLFVPLALGGRLFRTSTLTC